MKENLCVVIASFDGWSWLIAWLQVGVLEVFCLPLGPLATLQLEQLRDHPSIGRKIREYADDRTTNKLVIFCLHITTVTSLNDVLYSRPQFFDSISKRHVTLISLPPVKQLLDIARIKLSTVFHWHHFRHTTLGGLTTARLTIGWTRLNMEPLLDGSKIPRRPLNRFLEPAARNVRWRKSSPGRDDSWYPSSPTSTPYPWPWRTAPIWVDTYSVFSGENIQRHFTDKEKCQLLDLKFEWKGILPQVLEWTSGSTPPLRMMVEFIVSIGTPLKDKIGLEIERNGTELTKVDVLDWGRERAPWIGHGTTDNNTEIGERIRFFGWFWDSDELDDVAIACKGDDATVDLSLWAVGGCSEEMEHARAKIRSFLWRV